MNAFRAIALVMAIASTVAASTDEIVIRDVLVLPRVGQYGRTPVFIDPIEHQRVTGDWRAPQAGGVVKSHDGGDAAWKELRAGEDGVFGDEALSGGYAYAHLAVDSERVMILEAAGHGVVFVNGEPRAGDPYETGYVRLPVLLNEGSNHLLFHCLRGRLRAKLTVPAKDVFIDLGDLTLTDRHPAGKLMAGVVVVNATTQAIAPMVSGSGGADRSADHFRIPALSLRKVPLTRLEPVRPSANPLVVVSADDSPLDSVELAPRSREAGQTYKTGFVSAIDGSVQYYAVNPASRDLARNSPRGLVLSLHGAGVEAIGQADAYSPKSDIDIACPTNRRPYGFDWEDWGRLDALEVLDESIARLRPDPTRIALTGHSMGGHGTWILGALLPDRFAALGPSAGWISFATYSAPTKATSDSAVTDLLKRAASASDTFHLIPNLGQHGIYILHGADDDNVPADQARTMVKQLSPTHHDFVYHEQPAAGHWWDVSDEPGADCVDWAPLFDFFARHRLPKAHELREINFVTPSPGVSSRCHWITIDAQQRAGLPSFIQIRVDPDQRRYVGKTANVQRLTIDLVHLTGMDPVQLELDGQSMTHISWPADRVLYIARVSDGWHVTKKPSLQLKGPRRYGPFKDAFRNNMVFVYGTGGTPEENAWALAKARFDAETWWYRGNGSVDVMPDTEFDPAAEVNRNVILFGNAETLSCWNALLEDSPVQVGRGWAQIGTRRDDGDDLACLLIRPRPGSKLASVAVLGGSGIVGMRLLDRLPVFLSGVAYPDVLLIDPSVLVEGPSAVRCAGFFGHDWTFERGEFH